MANEFHQPGNTSFDLSEPKNYIQRLTCAQLRLLNGPCKYKQRLIAFITFGDGLIDEYMGADFCHGADRPLDNVRSNASFALFYKTEKAVELAFYTRFFVVSYDISRTAKEICRNSAVDKDRAFQAMSRMYTVQSFSPVTYGRPERYTLQINSISAKEIYMDTEFVSYIPYILIRDSAGKTPKWFSATVRRKTGEKVTVSNTIHGTVNTKGCWMMMRNFVWNWPNENIGYDLLAEAYVRARRDRAIPSPLLATVVSLLMKAPDLTPPQTERPGNIYTDRFLWWWRNFTYLEFIKYFAGLPFDKHNGWMFSLPTGTMGLAGIPNCWNRSTNPTREPNIYGYDPGKSWADLYMFKRTDRFTRMCGDTSEFK